MLWDKKQIIKIVHKCPRCGSQKIFKFWLDSDLASVAGDYGSVNEETYYTKEEYHVDTFDRPDIEIFHCGECDYSFS